MSLKILITGNEDRIARASLDVVRLFYPHAFVDVAHGEWDYQLEVCSRQAGEQLAATATLRDHQGILQTETVDEVAYQGEEDYNARKRVLVLAIKRLLERYTGAKPSPWGTLTGIRPTKIAHRMLDAGYADNQVLTRLTRGYDLSEDKARLLLTVAQAQRPYFHDVAGRQRLVSVYVGIPFCPTRCVYCSFPSTDLSGWKFGTERFVQALCQEIEAIGRCLREVELGVETIYVGGGTPTSLPAEQFEQVLASVGHWLKGNETREITVEAGRPDTFTATKLAAIKALGTQRISVNPQTMNDETLVGIGRKHTTQMVYEAFELTRQHNFDTVNLDMIIGLPGETPALVERTLAQVAELKPENLTVHTMALKRASHLNQHREQFQLPQAVAVEAMLQSAYAFAEEHQLLPYYLYRQKQILGGFENVGFAKPGHECIYNIQMMEERQTIIGLGGGSGSKWLNPVDLTLEATYNPKDPINYWERIHELVAKKVDKLRAFRYNGF